MSVVIIPEMAEYERVLCVKNEVFVYKIPARTSNRGYRAADWKLDQPDWTGRMRIVTQHMQLSIKLEDKNSGELFAKCPVESFPGVAIEAVLDSSRYFVLKIQDESARSAYIGIGFSDRGDSFDLNVALQDHFKQVKREDEAAEATQSLSQGPKLDLGFKAGQTIKININTKKNEEGQAKARSRPAVGGGGGLGLLPPPPGGVKLPAPPVAAVHSSQLTPTHTANVQKPQAAQNNVGMLLDFGSRPAVPQTTTSQTTTTQQQNNSDLWGDFTSSGTSNNSGASSDWVNFN